MDEHGITAICSKCSTLLTFTEDSLLRCVKCCVEYGPKSHVYDEQFPEHSPLLEQQRERLLEQQRERLLEQQRERLLEQQRRKEDGDPIKSPQGRGNPKEDGNPIESPQGPTIFIPFIRGTSASMSEQFVNHGGRTGGSAADGIADDLTATVEKYEAKGYEFQKIETIHVDVSPGCIGALMGKGKEYHPYDYLVFKKTSEPVRGQSA
jgi:hypothetical protein